MVVVQRIMRILEILTEYSCMVIRVTKTCKSPTSSWSQENSTPNILMQNNHNCTILTDIMSLLKLN